MNLLTRDEVLEKIKNDMKEYLVIGSFNDGDYGTYYGFKTFNCHEDSVHGYMGWCGEVDGYAFAAHELKYDNCCEANLVDKIFDTVIESIDDEDLIEKFAPDLTDEDLEDLESLDNAWRNNKIKMYFDIWEV